MQRGEGSDFKVKLTSEGLCGSCPNLVTRVVETWIDVFHDYARNGKGYYYEYTCKLGFKIEKSIPIVKCTGHPQKKVKK